MDATTLEIEEECFFRVAMGEVMRAVAEKYNVTTSAIDQKVKKTYRLLNHPSRRLESEPPIQEIPPLRKDRLGGAMVTEHIRMDKDIYLARLKHSRMKRGLEGIPGEWTGPLAVHKPEKPVWTPQLDALLGAASDDAIAKKLNYSAYAVRARRLKLKIKSFAGGGCDVGIGRFLEHEVSVQPNQPES